MFLLVDHWFLLHKLNIFIRFEINSIFLLDLKFVLYIFYLSTGNQDKNNYLSGCSDKCTSRASQT